MQEIFIYGLTILLGVFVFGLLIYSFYIVIFSKDTKYKSAKQASEAGLNRENQLTSETLGNQTNLPKGKVGKRAQRKKHHKAA